MTTNPVPPAGAPEPLELSVERAQRAWRQLGMHIRSITPSGLARFGLAALAIWAIAQLLTGAWLDLFPFQLGLALAYITLPLVNWMARFMPRQLAAIAMVIIEIALLVGFVGLVIPPIVEELTQLILNLPGAVDVQTLLGNLRSQVALLPSPTQVFIQNGMDQASDVVRGHALQLIQGALAVAVASALGVLNTLGFIIALLGVPTWLVAVMTDQQIGARFFNNMLPAPARADTWAVLRILDRTFSSYIRGQLGIAVLVGAMVFAGLWALERLGIANVQYRLVLAVIATVFQLIPAVGPIMGALPAVVAGFTSSRDDGLAVLLLYVGIQWVQGTLIAPRVQRRGPDMHPALMVIVLVAVAPFGFIWVLLAAPLAVAARDLFRYAYGRFGEPPRPAGLLPGATPVRPLARLRPR